PFSPAWPRPVRRRARRPGSACRAVRRAAVRWSWSRWPPVAWSLGLLSFDAVDRLAHVGADLGDDRLVDDLDVLTADGHHLQVGDELTPAAIGCPGGIARLEGDRVVVVAVGHIQRDVPVVGLDLGGVDGPVVQIRGAL